MAKMSKGPKEMHAHGSKKGNKKSAKEMRGSKSPKSAKEMRGSKGPTGKKGAKLLKQAQAAQDRMEVGAAVALVGMIGFVALIATKTLRDGPSAESGTLLEAPVQV